MNRFCTPNIPALFGVQFLSFLIHMAEKCFGRILMTFPVPDTTETRLDQEKLKIGSG